MRQMEVVMIANIGQEDLNLCAHVFDRVQEFNSMRISLAPIENSRSPAYPPVAVSGPREYLQVHCSL